MSGSSRYAAAALLGLVVAVVPRFARAQTDDAAEHNIELKVGEQVTLSTENVAKWSEGVKGIIDVRLTPDKSQFVIVGITPGQTSLLLIMKDGSEVRYMVAVRQEGRADEVTARDNIRLDFYFVELKRRSGFKAGLAWPGAGVGAGDLGATVDLSVETDLRTTRAASATATIASQALPRLDLAQAAGWAKVMRHATLITRNGAPGAYTSGGELNVRVGSGTAVGVSQIKYGTVIRVTPRYDKESGRIEVKVAAEVSTLGDASTDGLPGRNITDVNTVVNLELGQSVVLAGLLARDEADDSAGLPVLSQLPVIRYLFGVHQRSHARAENVLLIVPSVVEAVSPARRARVQSALDAYGKFRGSFRGALSPGAAAHVEVR